MARLMAILQETLDHREVPAYAEGEERMQGFIEELRTQFPQARVRQVTLVDADLDFPDGDDTEALTRLGAAFGVAILHILNKRTFIAMGSSFNERDFAKAREILQQCRMEDRS